METEQVDREQAIPAGACNCNPCGFSRGKPFWGPTPAITEENYNDYLQRILYLGCCGGPVKQPVRKYIRLFFWAVTSTITFVNWYCQANWWPGEWIRWIFYMTRWGLTMYAISATFRVVYEFFPSAQIYSPLKARELKFACRLMFITNCFAIWIPPGYFLALYDPSWYTACGDFTFDPSNTTATTSLELSSDNSVNFGTIGTGVDVDNLADRVVSAATLAADNSTWDAAATDIATFCNVDGTLCSSMTVASGDFTEVKGCLDLALGISIHSIAPLCAVAEFLLGAQPWFAETYMTWVYLAGCCVVYAIVNMVATVFELTWDDEPVYNFWDWKVDTMWSIGLAVGFCIGMVALGWVQLVFSHWLWRGKKIEELIDSKQTDTVKVHPAEAAESEPAAEAAQPAAEEAQAQPAAEEAQAKYQAEP